MDDVLSAEQGQKLLRLARKALENRLIGGGPLAEPDDTIFNSQAATFVTLKISGNLRGCIGNLTPVGTLWHGIRDNAVSAAFHDHRFSPLQAAELPHVHIDISILSPPRPLEYADAMDLLKRLQPGRDGVILRDGWRSATFLPQVWQQLPAPEQFLGHLCRKAGLTESAWRSGNLDISTYQVQSFQ